MPCRVLWVDQDQVFVGVGSDDVLSMCFLTFFNSGKPVLFPDITYSFYKVWAQLYRIPYRCPKLDEQFCLVKEDYYAENGGIIFPNPNAPTAIYEDLDFIEDILRHNPDSVVIVDEAYIDFAGKSALELIDAMRIFWLCRRFKSDPWQGCGSDLQSEIRS